MASKKLSEMTDEERYGKVGAEIRRLDPEAYKKRPKTLEGNLKLLKELRTKSKGGARSEPTVDFAAEMRRPKPTTNFAAEGRVKPAVGEPTKAMRDQARADVLGKDAMIAERASAAMKRNRSMLPSDRATNFRSQAEETGMNEAERAEKAREYATNIAMTAGAARAGSLARLPFARRKALDQARKRAEEMLDEKLAADMAGGFRKGGRIKKYAGGGSVSSASRRADGIAQRGKTRGKMI